MYLFIYCIYLLYLLYLFIVFIVLYCIYCIVFIVLYLLYLFIVFCILYFVFCILYFLYLVCVFLSQTCSSQTNTHKRQCNEQNHSWATNLITRKATKDKDKDKDKDKEHQLNDHEATVGFVEPTDVEPERPERTSTDEHTVIPTVHQSLYDVVVIGFSFSFWICCVMLCGRQATVFVYLCVLCVLYCVY